MLINELVNSESELLDTVTSILLRARSEGVRSVDMQQMLNDLGDPNLTPELMVDMLNRHTGKLKNVIAGSTVDEITLSEPVKNKQMTTKAEKTSADMNKLAVNKAMDNIKGSL